MKNSMKPRKRSPFSVQEDNQLIQLVKIYGEHNQYVWDMIAKKMKGRNARQCRERYKLFLNDGIKKKVKWTKEEDDILLSKYACFGPHWKMMEKFFIGRTSYNIKNRYALIQRHKNSKQKQKISHENETSNCNLNGENKNDINVQLTNNNDDELIKDIFQINFEEINEYFYNFY